MQIKLLHTADWHLGQNFYGFSRLFEQQIFLNDLLETIKKEQTDILLISGDIFDVSNPSADAMKCYYGFLHTAATMFPGLQIIIISGNHDSPSRLEAPRELLHLFNITVVGTMETTADGNLNVQKLVVPLVKNKQQVGYCIAVPFVRAGDYPHQGTFGLTYEQSVEAIYREASEYAKSIKKPSELLIAMGHLYASGGECSSDTRTERPIMGGINAVDVAAFDSDIQYIALGHLHKTQSVSSRQNIRYAGSPIPMSFAELDYRHCTLSVTINENNDITITPVPSRPNPLLRRIPEKPLPVNEVLAALQCFPNHTEQTAIDDYLQLGNSFTNTPSCPLLEVQVLLTGPEPTLKAQIDEILSNTNARLVKINVVSASADASKAPIAAPKELEAVQPDQVLKLEYARRYKEDIPGDLLLLFAEAMEEALVNETETKPAQALNAQL